VEEVVTAENDRDVLEATVEERVAAGRLARGLEDGTFPGVDADAVAVVRLLQMSGGAVPRNEVTRVRLRRGLVRAASRKRRALRVWTAAAAAAAVVGLAASTLLWRNTASSELQALDEREAAARAAVAGVTAASTAGEDLASAVIDRAWNERVASVLASARLQRLHLEALDDTLAEDDGVSVEPPTRFTPSATGGPS
jgi:hypothetical protein